MAADYKVREKIETYLTRRPVVLALLFLAAIVFFAAVTALSRTFQAQQTALADRWFTRGVADLNAQRYAGAVQDFRSALRYSRDDYSYQLNLAQALMGLHKTDEAYAYLINLWDRQPENGFVNLLLARIAAQKGQTDRALRYYHNAVYATWSGDQEVSRRYTRLELIEYLLKINAKTQAQAELIALAANEGDDPGEQVQLGTLFLRAQDYEHALAAFRLALKADPHNHAALAGAGVAAFKLARYPTAEKYLQEAVATDPKDEHCAALLTSARDTLLFDPFRHEISANQRARVVISDFDIAGERLKACSALGSSGQPASGVATLADSWAKMKPRIVQSTLRRDPDLVEVAMDLVFNIERQTSVRCGAPTGSDMALLLIARLHEGS
ncbi:MAG: tetratricopeptide repeat protein [Terriglobales bacterium]